MRASQLRLEDVRKLLRDPHQTETPWGAVCSMVDEVILCEGRMVHSMDFGPRTILSEDLGRHVAEAVFGRPLTDHYEAMTHRTPERDLLFEAAWLGWWERNGRAEEYERYSRIRVHRAKFRVTRYDRCGAFWAHFSFWSEDGTTSIRFDPVPLHVGSVTPDSVRTRLLLSGIMDDDTAGMFYCPYIPLTSTHAILVDTIASQNPGRDFEMSSLGTFVEAETLEHVADVRLADGTRFRMRYDQDLLEDPVRRMSRLFGSSGGTPG